MEPGAPPALSRASQAIKPKTAETGAAESRTVESRTTELQALESPAGTAKDVPGISPVRIDAKRLARLLFYALLLPAGVAIAFDFLLGLFPLLTLATIVTVFPIAGFLVLRRTLREMSDVIQQVAPEEVEEPEAEVSENDEFEAEMVEAQRLSLQPSAEEFETIDTVEDAAIVEPPASVDTAIVKEPASRGQ